MSGILVKRNFSFPLIKFNIIERGFYSSALLTNKKVPEEYIPKNLLQNYIGNHLQPHGNLYDNRPFKMVLKANKVYKWCSCGQSKSQPLCDGTHRIPPLQIKNKPIPFMVEETKEYWLCNCKKSEHRPFCDGTHKNESIQSALKYPKM